MKRHCLNLFLALSMTAALLTGCGSEAQNTAGTDTIAFETVDMDGNTVTEEVFTQSKLTMVNVWATYCNPCLSERLWTKRRASSAIPAPITPTCY